MGKNMTQAEKDEAERRLAAIRNNASGKGSRLNSPPSGNSNNPRLTPAEREKMKKMKKMKGGGAMNTKMSTKGGMKGGGMATKGYAKGGLKDTTEDQTGLRSLPEKVRNKMGFKKAGGMMNTKGGMKGGGMTTKGGMKGGGMATKGNTKGGAKKRTSKAKVRGAGIARKGVRPAKMR